VVVFPSPGAAPQELGRQIGRLRDAAAAAGMPEPLVMVDQEGGEVKRLASLPPHEPPSRMGADAALAEREGRATGRALASLGFDVNLAPVLDVPASGEAFIASRALANDPEAAGTSGAAFATGLASAGVAATAKHFPGLGTATVNTDEAPSTIEASRAELAPGLDAFEPVLGQPLSLVMVANAIYPAYDESRPASLSPRLITGLLREELGFEGAVITDDLGAGAIAQAGIDEGEAAVTAARAGADLLLFALSDGSQARAALVRALRAGRLEAPALETGCARVQTLRARLAAQPSS
jgi:beta-N-acetylhexosaminidase